jgi:hypothetical protein
MSITSVVAKMHCHSNEVRPQRDDVDQPHLAQVRLGAVWEGSTELQRASENAIFGHWTPCASTDLTIRDPNTSEFFKPGRKYYVTFTEAPD